MQTSTPERIKTLTEAGFWGSEYLHSLVDGHVARAGNTLAVADAPNREALIGDTAKRLSYQQLSELSMQLASLLHQQGLGQDSRLLVQLPNIVELVACYLAASRLGVIVSPIPVVYGSHELKQMAGDIGANAILTVEQFRESKLAAQAREALPSIPCITLNDIPQTIDPDLPRPDIDANDIVSICWTSGTTGTPKGVPRSHNMWLATARNTMDASGYLPGETLLAPFPLVNMAALGGFLFPWAINGGALILHHPLDPTIFLQQLQDEAVNFTIAPPALLNKLSKQPELWAQYDYSALRAIGSGSAPLSPGMIEVMEHDYGKPIVNFYGSNEGISLFSTPETAPSAELRAAHFPRFGVAGMPWRGIAHDSVKSKVIDPDTGDTLQRGGDIGELCFAGATVFDGYLNHDGNDTFTDDGFFRTGDLVELCGEPPRYYRIAGRSKDIINRGGMKISPSDIDVILETMPELIEGAVCPVPDEDLGEKICACVVPQNNADIDLDAINNYLQAQGLARFKLPQQLLIMKTLPRNPLGKVLRNALSAQAEKGITR